MDALRIGLVGAGGYGRTQLKFLTMMDAFEVLAVCDTDASAKAAVDGIVKTPYRFYGDYETMLTHENLDAVFITTPNHCHEAQTLAAIGKGLPVYLEKPPAITVSGCRELLDAANAANVPVMVGMQLRYGADYIKVKELIGAGEIGAVRMLLYKEFRNPFMPGSEGWRIKEATSGGAVMEKNVHQFDLFSWYCGCKPVRVSGMGGHGACGEVLDHYALTIEYESGAVATIGESLFAPGMNDETHMYILGDSGVIVMVDGGLRIKKHGDTDFTFLPSDQSHADMGHGGTEYGAYLSFLDYVKKGVRPYTCLEEGLDSVALSLAAEAAVAEKRVVDIAEFM